TNRSVLARGLDRARMRVGSSTHAGWIEHASGLDRARMRVGSSTHAGWVEHACGLVGALIVVGRCSLIGSEECAIQLEGALIKGRLTRAQDSNTCRRAVDCRHWWHRAQTLDGQVTRSAKRA